MFIWFDCYLIESCKTVNLTESTFYWRFSPKCLKAVRHLFETYYWKHLHQNLSRSQNNLDPVKLLVPVLHDSTISARAIFCVVSCILRVFCDRLRLFEKPWKIFLIQFPRENLVGTQKTFLTTKNSSAPTNRDLFCEIPTPVRHPFPSHILILNQNDAAVAK